MVWRSGAEVADTPVPSHHAGDGVTAALTPNLSPFASLDPCCCSGEVRAVKGEAAAAVGIPRLHPSASVPWVASPFTPRKQPGVPTESVGALPRRCIASSLSRSPRVATRSPPVPCWEAGEPGRARKGGREAGGGRERAARDPRLYGRAVADRQTASTRKALHHSPLAAAATQVVEFGAMATAPSLSPQSIVFSRRAPTSLGSGGPAPRLCL